MSIAFDTGKSLLFMFSPVKMILVFDDGASTFYKHRVKRAHKVPTRKKWKKKREKKKDRSRDVKTHLNFYPQRHRQHPASLIASLASRALRNKTERTRRKTHERTVLLFCIIPTVSQFIQSSRYSSRSQKQKQKKKKKKKTSNDNP